MAEYLSPRPDGGLNWGPLTEGRLVRRYKRFLADVELASGEFVTAHTPNTGSMLGCSEPGRRVWLSSHDAPSRKYKYTLEMIEMPASPRRRGATDTEVLVGVNTGVPNKLVKAAAVAGKIPEFPFPVTAIPEVRRGNSRLDLMLSTDNGGEVMVEIKNCSLVENGTALFPDAVTARGRKHLEELAALSGEGKRAVLLILAQRADAEQFRPADHIDPAWGRELREATRKGVELLAYTASLDFSRIRLGDRLPAIL